MGNKEVILSEPNPLKEFEADTNIVGEQTEKFLRLVYPAYLVDRNNIDSLLDNDSTLQLEGMTYFRLKCCTADTVDELFEAINAKIEKLFTALHSIGVSISYGLISRNGIANLVLGIYSSSDVENVKNIAQGMLSGIDMDRYVPCFGKDESTKMNYGILSGIPSLYVQEKRQTFSLSSIMRSLNGQDYTLLFIAKPVSVEVVTKNISELIMVKDKAFAVSKRNIARANSYSETTSHTTTVNDSKNSVAPSVGQGAGMAAGAVGGALIGQAIIPVPGVGAAIGAAAAVGGAAIGGAIGGGLGTVIGNLFGGGRSHSEGYSDSVSKAITDGETISGDIQNGFAIELMSYADKAIERLKSGQNNGIWQTAITYSAKSKISCNIIKACLCGELSKPDPDRLPLLVFVPKPSANESLKIPDFLGNENQNPLCACINSAELGLLCTVPTESVPDFELRIEKAYPLVRSILEQDSVKIGNLTDGKQVLGNMPFALSLHDLNKHTFVCGITGSGKSTTVKKVLKEANKPFLVIESAKKEYRNLDVDTTVYTLGKPEINCPQINPFYIMPGVSPQTHIDYLKDLFNASFSFYGPMPYILEKCLHSVYENKGWNLTLGFHPLLSNSQSNTNFFNIEYSKKKYALASHKYLFPTMQELKDEIARYVEEELKYGGEVADNVKTAIKVRLENLCIGAKGFTFNTCEYLDFTELLEKNVIFELEGLADDSDKAFSVGLLVIFINEYRQIAKEISGNAKTELKHLLVIEEAHRLLKNLGTERSNETEGNPKGKAVEHFTNMIAEMRSYGQGVIVAEQIPTKLAPDVIKNSSNKIVQRVVSADDQQVIANTIGITADDAIRLGTLETGYAFCHKEGMALPTIVKISNKYNGENGSEQNLDVFVSDENLYNQNDERFEKINLGMIRSVLGNSTETKQKALALINTLFIENAVIGMTSCENAVKYCLSELNKKGVSLVLCKDEIALISEYLTEVVLMLLVRGVYCAPELPSDELSSNLKNAILFPTEEKIKAVKNGFASLYNQNPAIFAKQNIAELVKRSLRKNSDVDGTIREYFIRISVSTLNDISMMVRGGEII